MKYAIISNQKRAILLERVLMDQQSIKTVAEQLKIKFPSAKSIIRTYKKTGRIFNKKKSRKVLPKEHEEIEAVNVEVCSVQELIGKQKNVQKQEKSQKIATTNQNQKQDQQEQNAWQCNYNMFGQQFANYPLISPVIYPPYFQFPTMPFFGNNNYQ